MIRTAPDHVISMNEAPSRLAEILQTISGDQIWLVAQDGTPKVAIVDAQFLEQLLRRAWFDELATKSQSAFREYLRREGHDPDSMTEDEVESTLQK